MQPEPQKVGNSRRFSTAVCERIQFYVYVLRDPRDRSIFYVGKGAGNRVFQHVDEALESPKATDKLERIRAIHAAGLPVDHQIVRHGMTEEQAFEVESALIDWIGIDELANAVAGHYAGNRGTMSVDEIVAVYDAKPVKIEVPAFIVILNRLFERGVTGEKLYEISRGDWAMGPRRELAKYCIAAYRGLVRAVYRVESWESVPTKPGSRRRWRFHGTVAAPEPEQSSLTVIRKRMSKELIDQVFAFVLKVALEKKLLKGKAIGVDATMLEANAAMKSIVRRDGGATWKQYLTKLAKEAGNGLLGAVGGGADEVEEGELEGGSVDIVEGEDRTVEVGAGQVGTGQVGADQVGVDQVGAGKDGATQVGVDKVGAAQAGAAQVGAAQVGAAQVYAAQVGVSQVGASQVGTTQDGMAQDGAAKVGPAQIDRLSVCSLQPTEARG